MNLELAEVRSTKDYDLFKRLNYNREIMMPRIDKIVESIKKHGFILPILINQNYMVVDGQHRLEAARKCNSEVLYIQFNITDEILPILISTVNTTSRNWSNEDFLNMWVSLDKETYVYMSNIVDRECLRISHLLRIASVTGNKENTLTKEKYRKGELTFTHGQREKIATRIKHLNDIRDSSESYKGFRNSGPFIAAILGVIINLDYDHKRMMRVLYESPGSIAKCKISADYTEVFSSLYNKRLKNRIKFSSGL